jgi:hypothetical protein
MNHMLEQILILTFFKLLTIHILCCHFFMEHPENYFLDWKPDYQKNLLKHFSRGTVSCITIIYIIHGLFRGFNIKDSVPESIVAMEMEHLFKQSNNHMLDGKLHGTNRTQLFLDFY